MNYKCLYHDVLSLIFSNLSFKDMISAGLANKAWYHSSTNVPCRKESLRNKNPHIIDASISSKYGYHITNLDTTMDGYGISFDDTMTLANAITKSKVLKSIALNQFIGLNAQGVEAIMNAIKLNPHISDLDISWSYHLKKNSTQIVTSIIEQMPSITFVDMTGNREGMQHIGSMIGKSKTLLSINLSSSSIRDENAKIIANAIKKSSSITSIGLDNNDFGVTGIQVLAEAIIESSTLKSISLATNPDMGVEGSIVIANLLMQSKTLTEIDLTHNRINDDVSILIADAIKQNVNLNSIKFGNNNISMPGVIAFADTINKSSSLKLIDFGGCTKIGFAGTKLILEAIKNNQLSKLFSLNLSGCFAGSDAEKKLTLLRLIKECVLMSSSLTHIYINGNLIKHDGAKIIASAIEQSNNLALIDISNNLIGLKGSTLIANAIAKSTSMTSINLSSNKIFETEAITSIINKSLFIKSLDMSNNSKTVHTKYNKAYKPYKYFSGVSSSSSSSLS